MQAPRARNGQISAVRHAAKRGGRPGGRQRARAFSNSSSVLSSLTTTDSALVPGHASRLGGHVMDLAPRMPARRASWSSLSAGGRGGAERQGGARGVELRHLVASAHVLSRRAPPPSPLYHHHHRPVPTTAPNPPVGHWMSTSRSTDTNSCPLMSHTYASFVVVPSGTCGVARGRAENACQRPLDARGARAGARKQRFAPQPSHAVRGSARTWAHLDNGQRARVGGDLLLDHLVAHEHARLR